MQRKHWTQSNIKGAYELNDLSMLNAWRMAQYKGYFSESNWITSNYAEYKDKVDLWDPLTKVPLFIGTNKLCCMVVDLSKSSTAQLPEIRIRAYDVDTNAEITITHTSARSTTPKTTSLILNDKKQYLSWSYDIIEFTASTTWTQGNGLLLKRRANIRVEYKSGSTWYDFSDIGYKTYLKFIEIGVGFDNATLPTYNEQIPAGFLASFYSMISGKFSGVSEASGRRYANYIIPFFSSESELSTPKICEVSGSIPRTSFLHDVLVANNSYSEKDGTRYYSTQKLILPSSPSDGYFQPNTGDSNWDAKISLKYNEVGYDMLRAPQDSDPDYTYWGEWNLIGEYLRESNYDPETDYRLKSFFAEFYLDLSRNDIIMNLASASTMPGYSETQKNNIMEFYSPAQSPSSINEKLPIDNISLSIIKNTLALPFWSRINNDVVQVNYSKQDGKTKNEVYVSPSPYFFMQINPTFVGDEDITSNIFVKFIC